MRWLLCFLLIILSACESNPPVETRFREALPADAKVMRPYRLQLPDPVLDSLSRTVPVVLIPLDTVDYDENVHWLKAHRAVTSSHRVLTTRIQAVQPVQDSLLFLKSMFYRREPIVFNRFTKEIVREWDHGLGLNAMNRATAFASNDEFIAVSEFANRRVQILNNTLRPVRVLPYTDAYISNSAITSEAIFRPIPQHDSLFTQWRLERQSFDWHLPDTLQNPVLSMDQRLFPGNPNITIYGNKDFMVMFSLFSPYAIVTDKYGTAIGMLARNGKIADYFVDVLREQLHRPAYDTTVGGTRILTRQLRPFWQHTGLSPDGIFYGIDHNQQVFWVDLHHLASGNVKVDKFVLASEGLPRRIYYNKTDTRVYLAGHMAVFSDEIWAWRRDEDGIAIFPRPDKILYGSFRE